VTRIHHLLTTELGDVKTGKGVESQASLERTLLQRPVGALQYVIDDLQLTVRGTGRCNAVIKRDRITALIEWVCYSFLVVIA
jgi:hypothetical protein